MTDASCRFITLSALLNIVSWSASLTIRGLRDSITFRRIESLR